MKFNPGFDIRPDYNPGRCYSIYGNVGDVIIVPLGWAHCTINADVTKNMSFGAWR